ncbi:hypothetical protein B0H17DRAFT_338827 [Mycena rosella]|uniref:Uncharacterized protein n=1 Tax=Mycena rosella TaxID=1033263 RepID=A0AAD7G254_MYCRO|nr:hypothetical protein B0H17DRAFT_338827 [Mycena rosella]
MFMHANVNGSYCGCRINSQYRIYRSSHNTTCFLLPRCGVADAQPHILDLRTNMPMHDMEVDLIFLLRSLAKLRKVVFPRFECTTPHCGDISTAPRSWDAGVSVCAGAGTWRPLRHTCLQAYPGDGAFPSLWDLSLTISLNDGCAVFAELLRAYQPHALYFDSYLVESPAVVHELLSLLAETVIC